MRLPGVVIVGCGNVAGGYDMAGGDARFPLSHAGAYRHHGGFDLRACVEPDDGRREGFMRHWGIAEGAASMQELLDRGCRVDVVAICSPTARHAEHLAAALRFGPRLVVCEKPVTPSLAETRHWIERYEAEGVALLVNHTRRWAPDVVRLARALARGERDWLRSVSGTYSKGLLNNGSHMLDLLRMLCGDLTVVAAGEPRADFFAHDPSVPFLLRSGAGVPIAVNVADAGDYSIFELQLVTSDGVISMEEGGQRWRERTVVPSPTFAGYRTLDAGRFVDGEYRSAMTRMIGNQFEFLQSGAPIACTGRDALAAQELCVRVLEHSSRGT